MTQQLDKAVAARDSARIAFNAATRYTKAWRKAEEALLFWQSKVAFLEHAPDGRRCPDCGCESCICE
jgi:hypothetical protein